MTKSAGTKPRTARRAVPVPADSHSTKEAFVYRELRQSIIDGQLLPGTHLVVADVAKAMRTSSIPVRDGLRRLASEGLVVIEPHVGAFVAPLPVERLAQVLEVRGAIEELAVRLAAPVIDAQVVAGLRRLVDQMDTAARRPDPGRFARLNREFHSRIHHASDNAPLLEVLDGLLAQSERGQTLFRLNTPRMRESNKEHRDLLIALERGDGDAAAEVAARHRRATMKALAALAKS